MPKTLITPEIAEFIKNNRFEMSRKDLGAPFGITKSVVAYYMKKNSLTVPKEVYKKFITKKLQGRTSFTKQEDDFIKKNYLKLSIKTLAKKINRSGYGVLGRMKAMGLIIPNEIIEERIRLSLFQKGQISVNKGKKQVDYMTKKGIENSKKTRFKKGGTSWNKKPVGSERISKDGYIYIKTAEPNKYELKHRVIFEKEFGKIPKGMLVQFKDGNRKNINPKNLYLISRSDQVTQNKFGGSKLTFKERKTVKLITSINKKLKTIENGKK